MVDRFDEILTEMRADRADRDELIRFVGELNHRSEIAFRDVVGELRELRAETRASTAAIEQSTEMTKAHTRAIFALIDRLEGGGGLAPAT